MIVPYKKSFDDFPHYQILLQSSNVMIILTFMLLKGEEILEIIPLILKII